MSLRERLVAGVASAARRFADFAVPGATSSNTPKGLAAPVPINDGPGVVAPWPLIDRYPTILNDRASLAYIRAIFRSCLAGYRQQYVDLLDELLVGEPHGYGVLSHRVNTVAGGRLEVTPCALPKDEENDHPDTAEAATIADDIQAQLDAIPARRQALQRLLWGLYYGVSGAEIIWDFGLDGWRVVGLNFINSRRIAYPDQSSWRPRIWDQGTVSTIVPIGSQPTTQLFGLCVDDFPGKFIIFEANIRGDYPTREGLGQQLAYWFGMKAMTARGAGEFIERYGKPWATATYSTTEPGLPGRAATNEDIQHANAVITALGLGSLSSAVIPDAIKIEMQGPGLDSGSTSMTHKDWLGIIDAYIEEVVLTQSGTTTQGTNGARAAKETMKESTRETFRYDAQCLCDVLKRDLVRALMMLRHPGKEHLCPDLKIHVDELPDPLAIIDVASKAASAGLPVACEPVAKNLGLELVPAEPGSPPRRMLPLQPIEPVDLPESQKPAPPQPAQPLPGALAKKTPSKGEKILPDAVDASDRPTFRRRFTYHV